VNTPVSELKRFTQNVVTATTLQDNPTITPVVAWKGGLVSVPDAESLDEFWTLIEQAALAPCLEAEPFVLIFSGWFAPVDDDGGNRLDVAVFDQPTMEDTIFYWVWDDDWMIHGRQKVYVMDNGHRHIGPDVVWQHPKDVEKPRVVQEAGLHFLVAQEVLSKEETTDVDRYLAGLVGEGYTVVRMKEGDTL
jgi:hypothetical protein